MSILVLNEVSEPKAYAKALSYLVGADSVCAPSSPFPRHLLRVEGHDVVFKLLEDKVYVYVLSAYGHY